MRADVHFYILTKTTTDSDMHFSSWWMHCGVKYHTDIYCGVKYHTYI